MDLIGELGELALGSRFKRLSDLLMQEGRIIYQSAGLDFQPKWFPMFSCLVRRGPSTIMDIARSIGMSHPSILTMMREMTKAGLVKNSQSRQDKRKRVIELTDQGRQLADKLEPVWDDIRAAMRGVVLETGHDLLGVLSSLEQVLERQGLNERFQQKHKLRQSEEIEILAHHPQLSPHFAQLNYEWIDAYFEVEAWDKLVLSNPEEYIIGKGGHIFYARDKKTQQILGTVALIHHGSGRYELAKMAVTEKARGKQIGRKLADSLIQKAKDMGAKELFLETSSKLAPAIALYRKLGFQLLPFKPSEKYARSDVRMGYPMG